MKKTFIRMAGIVALAFLAAPLMVRAQQPMQADIPFAFTAGKAMLPAGEYVVKELGTGIGVLQIQSKDGNGALYAASFSTRRSEAQSECKLIFHRYGNRYFLWQVWSGGSPSGRELPKSAKEKEQALAARHEAQDQVTIVARLTPR